MEKKLFTEFGLAEPVLKAIADMGFEQASPIQTAAIPVILEGRHVIGLSQTGSGKTAAYAIPAVARCNPEQDGVQVVVLCPTRELTVQVAEEFAKITRHLPKLRHIAIYGGQDYTHQIRALRQGAQIVIATPGRLLDHLGKGTLTLDKVHCLILDEADRMLDMGFKEEMDQVLADVPESSQKLFFSATMPSAIRDLIQRNAKGAAKVEITHKELTVPSVDQRYYEVKSHAKLEVLHRLIDHENIHLGIIFCNTKKGVDELVEHLQARGYSVDRLHGDMAQGMRQRVMQKFRDGSLELLVATDVAARGLDIDNVEVVFNYDLPHDEEDYVHRIGRTGRAGRSGRAISIVSGREVYRLQHIMRYTKATIRRMTPPSLEEVEARRMDAVFGKLRETLQKGGYPACDEWIDRLLDQGFPATEMVAAMIHLLRGESKPAEVVSVEAESSNGTGWPRLFINIGKNDNLRPADLKGAILNECGVQAEQIGKITLYTNHSLVEIEDSVLDHVITALKRTRIRQRKPSVRRDREEGQDPSAFKRSPRRTAPDRSKRARKSRG